MPEDSASLQARLLSGLRVAQNAITLTVLLGLALANLVAGLARSLRPGTAVACYVALLAVTVVDAALVRRGRHWGRVARPVAAGVLVVSAFATSAVAPSGLIGPDHWSLGVVGWFGVLLFFGSGLRDVVAFLVAYALLAVTLFVTAGRSDLATMVALTTVLVSVSGFQLAVAAAGRALTGTAGRATAAAAGRDEAERVAAAARAVHADRGRRYAAVRATVVPLLQELRAGTSVPSDPRVQRRAALEAARLRRLFAEHRDVEDPLAAEVQGLVDAAEARGIDVRSTVRAGVPVPRTVAAALVDEVSDVLLAASGAARLTVGAAGEAVTVSVVAESTGNVRPGRRDGVCTTVLRDGGRTWVEARWREEGAT